ncbi:MAG: DUF512 domain-containing protein [Thermacetogeniaceae bacterium]
MLSLVLRRAIREGNILPITSVCNLRCIFCSNCQNPCGVETFALPHLPLSLVRRLIPLLDPRRKIIIGEAASRINEGEPFAHPDFWAILSMIRGFYPNAVIQITTNGTLLNRASVKRLYEMRPVELNISLNSATRSGRWLLMGDSHVEKVLEGVELVAEAGIAYNGSIVAMPHIVGWQDLYATCRFLQEHGAATIRLFLPGFTKFAASELRFEPFVMYRRLRLFQEEQEAVSKIPLLLEPFLWEEGLVVQGSVAGVIPSSPADKAGVRRGNVIKSVNGRAVKSRVDAYKKIFNSVYPSLEIEGKKDVVAFRKRRDDGAGIVMNYDIDWSVVEKVKRCIRKHQARNVLVLTSEWGLPWLRQVLPEWEKVGARVRLEAVKNRFFGGSIASAGLLTTLDFRKALRQIIGRYGDIFEMVLLPGRAFDVDGRDLLGRHYTRLKELTRGKIVVV